MEINIIELEFRVSEDKKHEQIYKLT